MHSKNKTGIFPENDSPIDIRYDSVFKAVFTKESPESQQALSKLISALIGREITIVTLCVNEPAITNLKDRQIRFDINCRAENGERINVEMSFNPKPYEPIRLEFYAGVLFTGQDIRGTDKKYKDLKETYQIAILAKDRFFADEEFYHCFEYYDPIRRMSLDGKTRIITMELCKVKKIVDNPTEEMSVSELWAYYFEYLTDREKHGKIKEIVEKEGGIAMANQVLHSITQSEIEHIRYMTELKNRLDYQSEMAYEREEGHKEASKEIARNALAEGLSIEFIQKITGLDPEVIQGLTRTEKRE
jgi:predicted transposase/invertase (TIGR01784 family)